MEGLMQFIDKNTRDDDYNHLEDQTKDSIWSNNIDPYHKAWMREVGKDLLSEFWNSQSDACPLESDEHDSQIIAFQEWIAKKFS